MMMALDKSSTTNLSPGLLIVPKYRTSCFVSQDVKQCNVLLKGLIESKSIGKISSMRFLSTSVIRGTSKFQGLLQPWMQSFNT